ncbi:hypothetical protein LZP85_10970 [Priestia flexa]|jgi:hypothetical protein|uniref:Uncharacterized protein n=2 Tax=Priestia TaxID=2800373 RepID=A0A0V8JR61_9BACI|nr:MULTISPECIES: hypothetical protein [Bacillaceae]KSU89341.1 hypothetical protein AS180_03370 [Priestia veravalensis]KZB93358.1 hypothetical protein A2U94_00020 [Bacillus sp. VT 712]MBN8436319.1 hypothetical protein [Priestia flexa]MCA0968839.1 hypothetical protein [Priestia flexa]MCA1203821.1 hypothetical protein [Priestia flexa]
MIILNVIQVGTFLLLFVAFLCLFWTIRRPKPWKGIALLASFFVCSAPLLYALYDESKHNYLDANIGLGLAYIFTWGLTTLLAVIALFRTFFLRPYR